MNLTASMIKINGHNNDLIDAYIAKPSNEGNFPGMIVAHHMPGMDEWSLEVTRRLAHHGFIAICPNLHYRSGPGPLNEVVQKVRDSGGLVDEVAIGDIAAALTHLNNQQSIGSKVGIIGFCSGGRIAYMASAKINGIAAAIDCWGGNIIPTADRITVAQPVPPISMTSEIQCPLLGIFGNEDSNPNVDQVDSIEVELTKLGKVFEFHRYDGAGHGFFNWSSSNYRPEQSEDGWKKVFEFCGKYLD